MSVLSLDLGHFAAHPLALNNISNIIYYNTIFVFYVVFIYVVCITLLTIF